MDHSKTILLRGAHYKNEYFLRYCTYLLWDFANFSRWNSDYFQIEFLQFPWGKWPILRLFYWGVYYVKMCIFWDIALIYVCIGLSQFLEVKSRPHLNRIFMFFFSICFQFCILASYPLSSLWHCRNVGSGAQPQPGGYGGAEPPHLKYFITAFIL